MCTERPISREHQYTGLINVRNAELAAYWTRYNIQAVLNLGLLVAAVSAKPDSFIGQYIFYASIVGFCLALIWLFMTIWSKRLIAKRWDKYIRRYERCYSEELFPLFTLVEAKENKKGFCNKLKKHWNNLNILARAVPLILIVLWLILGINAFMFPPSPLKSQEVITPESEMKRLSITNDKLSSEIERLKNEVSDIRKQIRNKDTDKKRTGPNTRK
ncbi:MAG: hypothetical protein JW725_05480 [Candidatus Babeliaceae bacterium]|nr:hypothetical protein [Candidatus Babeliaceae bacterium]